MVMWHYGRETLRLGRHAANFGGFKHCDSGDKTYLICHLIYKDHAFKGLCDFMDGRPS